MVDAIAAAAVGIVTLGTVISAKLGGLGVVDVCGAHDGLEERLSKKAAVVVKSGNHLGDVSSGVVVHETVDIARSPSCVICPRGTGSR